MIVRDGNDSLAWTERELQDNIVQLARSFGWMAVHFGGDQKGRAHYDAAGFPDLLLVHADPPQVWFRELKSRTGKLTARQERWKQRLTHEGLNYAVWRPADWPDIVRLVSFGAAEVA